MISASFNEGVSCIAGLNLALKQVVYLKEEVDKLKKQVAANDEPPTKKKRIDPAGAKALREQLHDLKRQQSKRCVVFMGSGIPRKEEREDIGKSNF